MMRDNKKRMKGIAILAIVVVVIALSATYAFIHQTFQGTKSLVIRAGDIQLELLEGENNLTIENALPMYDQVGMIQDAFSFQLYTKGKRTLDYQLKLVNITDQEKEQLSTGIVKYGLTKNGTDQIDFLSNLEEGIIEQGRIFPDQPLHYDLRLWIDSSVEDEKEINGKSLSYKIAVSGTEVSEVTVEFEGIEGAQSFVVGEPYGKLPTPVKTGYIFNGWYNAAGEQVSDASIVKSTDKKLTPKWNRARFGLEIDPAGGTWEGTLGTQTIYLEYEETKQIANPIKTGYSFQKWEMSGEGSKLEGKTFTMGSENATLTAVWKVNHYTLTVKPEGGSFEGKTGNQDFTIDYLKTKTIEDPIREGYSFAGWDVTGEGSVLNTTVFTMGSENAVLTAKWKVNQYKWISYHYQQNVNGEGYTKVDADTGTGEADFQSQVTPPVLSYTGFTSPSPKIITIQVDKDDPPTKNKVDYNYTRNQYALKINPNGGVYKGQSSVTTRSMYYEEVIQLDDPEEREGYYFNNWTVSKGTGTINSRKFTMGEGDSEITAQWTPRDYSVFLDANGGSIDDNYLFVIYGRPYGEDSYIFEQHTPTKDGYDFLGWYTEPTGGERIENTTIVTKASDHTLYAHWAPWSVSTTPFYAKNYQENEWDESCTTYDDGTSTFFTGECKKNYVWYSGKLWRIVLKNNETGATKLITDNPITTISYNEYEKNSFEGSYVQEWLNQDFLSTLHHYQDYLENTGWDVSSESSEVPSKPSGSTIVQNFVGLLNYYEYYHGFKDYMSFLRDERFLEWWLLNPSSFNDTYSILIANGNPNISPRISNELEGVRPVISMKKSIQIIAGTGTQEDPYRLLNDVQEIDSDNVLLNTRYSGEYLRFNNELYRIVQVENNRTKIVSVDKNQELGDRIFDDTTGDTVFSISTLKQQLEDYYQSLGSPYKDMIATNQTWYLGSLRENYYYKNAICMNPVLGVTTKDCVKVESVATATLGLPRIGEMFTSQISRQDAYDFWTLTPDSVGGNYTYYIPSSGSAISSKSTEARGIRLSMYLKETVKLASGDGTYEHPYELDVS